MSRRHFLRTCTAVALGLSLLLVHLTSAQRGATLRIYLARHGQTDWNVEGRLQGSTDTHLNDTGRQQARELAKRLTGLQLDAVYSSALSRSRETAEIVHGSVPLTSLAGLNERKLGKFEGLRVAATTTAGAPTRASSNDSAVTQEYVRRTTDPADSLDGGESLTQFSTRISTTLATIRKQHASGTLLIVGHGVTNKMILRALLGLTLEQANTISQANDELYLIELDRAVPPRLWKLITEKTLGEL
ncbi:MAG: histidine phosphatase family protein [Acidobacteria bacterium]|nr:histidine phosphatase family protein [Acidobacteriota bacterium]MBI3261838.1 histidine phosphatase family protein [Acidobacteriota bacterium]